jgi:SRSO17 transposase
MRIGVGPRQYCGRLGKIDNCQVAVSLSLANERGSVPLAYQLYLPKEWAEDPKRRERAGVPKEIKFRAKSAIAREQIEAARVAGIARGVVLADAWYGDEADFRDWLSVQNLEYALGVRPATSVWWGSYRPAQARSSGRGRPRTRLKRDARHQPMSVLEVARALPQKSWRTLTWRAGTNAALSSRFARVRVCAAHADRARGEKWLLMEWPVGEAEPTHYWLSTLPETLSCKQLVSDAKGRWLIERDYEELKSELGLSHYEGRNWRGFHHHATLCIAAYGFLMLERLSGFKKTPLDSKNLPYPKASAHVDPGPMQRHVPWSIASVRFRLARLLAQTLPKCPCCGIPRGSPTDEPT